MGKTSKSRRFSNRVRVAKTADADPVAVECKFTVAGETRKAIEGLAPEVLRSLLAGAIVAAVNKAAEVAPVVPARTFSKVIVSKSDSVDEERYVLGIVMEPDEVDSQGETQTAEEIRKAQQAWMAAYRSGGNTGHLGLQHKELVNDKVAVLECWIQKSDETMGDQAIKAGSWMMAERVLDDALWKAVKAGDITGFSIGGTAVKKKPAA